MPALMWFRTDLRTHDNRALSAAAAAGDGVTAVFAACPGQWREHDWGSPKIDFIWRHLRALHARLGELHIPLHVLFLDRFSDVPGALLKFARDEQCDALYFNREYEVNEARRDEAVESLFRAHRYPTHAFHDQTIIPPDTLRTRGGSGGYYTVFSPFRRAWTAQLLEAGVPEILPDPQPQPRPSTSLPPFPSEAKVAATMTTAAPRSVIAYWPAGEDAARRRLEEFTDRGLRTYKDDRNFPGNEHGTSRLSPYLAAGVISPRVCLRAAYERNRNRLDKGDPNLDAWISELVWREFYRHVLVGYPRVCMNQTFRPEYRRFPFRDDPAAFDAWCEGRTGIPIVDAGMRQLRAIGWMHNRVRMIVAMVLTKNLLIDYRLGERHFMNHLVDGDFAQNNGGWQWSASTGTDAAPYFRIFNPYAQSQRFDPDGTYITRYVPELDGVAPAALHDPDALSPELRLRLGYPEPIVDTSRSRERAIEAFKAAAASE